MIPVFSISAIIIAIANFFCSIQLYFSYREKKHETIGNFAKVFLLVSLFWFFIAPPKLITTDLKLIQIFLDLSVFFGYLAGAYFLLIPLRILYPKISPRPLFFLLVILGIIFLVFNFLNLKPALIHFHNNFVFWSENRSLSENIISGSLFGIIGIIAAIFFLLGGLKSQEKAVRSRAFLIAIALFLIPLGAIIRFVFGSLFNIFISTSIAFILGGVISSILMIIAIFFVKPESKKFFYKQIYKETE